MTIATQPGLRHRLRLETRAAHAALEAVLPIAGDRIDLEIYRDHLRFLLGFHQPVEGRLKAIRELEARVPDLARRWKSPSLRHDLRLAGDQEHTPLAEDFPRPGTPPQALGVLYVLEGATLGARSLLPRLHREGVLPGPLGSTYLDGYGSDSAAMWNGFCQALDRVEDVHADEVVSWAATTFESLRSWRREWQRWRS